MLALCTLLVASIGWSGCIREGTEPSGDGTTPASASGALAFLSMDAGPAPTDGGTDGGMGGGTDGGTGTGDGGIAPPPAGRCWAGPFTMYFNGTLDNPLDVALGWNIGMRLGAFTNAAANWNVALAAIGSPVRINVVDATTVMPPLPVRSSFAADWAGVMCLDPVTDPTGARNAYYHDFFNPDGHHGNMVNTGSFGHPVQTAMAPRPNGPGWTGNQEMLRYDAGMDIYAETMTTPPPGMVGNLMEADIIFHTHTLAMNMNCDLIPWAIPVGAASLDFQSVALHELGHALGLGHLGPDALTPGNVMRPTINLGQVLQINPLEIAALNALYGPGGACPPPPPPPPGP